MATARLNLKKQVAIEPTKQGLARFEAAVAQVVKDADQVKADRWEVQPLLTSDGVAKVGGLHAYNAESAGFELKLPKPSTEDEGREMLFINVSSSTNTVELRGTNCTVRGVASVSLSGAYSYTRLVAYDGNWWLA